ncbi:MAG: DegT/DnrJ/EryC1/StrS family aminotransferase [Ignavibacteria bacterium]|nr:DegT/DnrJ/EryC1/StrS family aminotransferase [Ignavibacteria bacterium]
MQVGHKIQIYKPFLKGSEKKYINECIKSNYVSSKGKFVTQFELRFAEYIGVKYATSCCNGTCALQLAIASLYIGKGDEVILPSLTFIATANSVINNGARPVIVDVGDDWQINPEEVRKKINKRTKAIIAVHLYGFPCNLDELLKISQDYEVYLIEDCAEAIGNTYNGRRLGSIGDVAAFSFYGNKTITTGEGGMLTTNNYKIFKKASQMKMHGAVKMDNYYFVSFGFNYRMTNLSAAIGLAQLEKIDKIIERKRKIEEKYRKYLKNLPITFYNLDNSKNIYWLVTVLVENTRVRNRLRKFLTLNGIETRPFFYPLHTLPMFKSEDIKCPVAESIAGRGISLPSFPGLRDKDIKYICDKINEFYGITKLK